MEQRFRSGFLISPQPDGSVFRLQSFIGPFLRQFVLDLGVIYQRNGVEQASPPGNSG